MNTIRSSLADAAHRLKRAGIEEPYREARVLLSHVLGVDQARIIGHPDAPVSDPARFLAIIDRRAGRTPMSHILGRREFWSLDFRVTPDTLDPRPESETLVEAALRAVGASAREAPIKVLDLGTGTGCLLLSVLNELPFARGVGVDRSERAVAVARANAVSLGLNGRAQFIVGDWASALSTPFDLVLANPPYVRTAEIESLQPEVRHHEPILALDGGVDGLASYRDLTPHLLRLLAPTATAVLELGAGQADAVRRLIEARGLQVINMARDISGELRCMICAPCV
jgi:release factor glutamine methyltransferase